MKIIGLTGGIAAGKSTVSTILREQGATIVDADLLAREIVRPGEPALEEIAKTFGREVLTPSGELDRKRLGALVFQDPAKRALLDVMETGRVDLLPALTDPERDKLLELRGEAERLNRDLIAESVRDRIGGRKIFLALQDELRQVQQQINGEFDRAIRINDDAPVQFLDKDGARVRPKPAERLEESLA